MPENETILINIKLSLWSAIKLRIAGVTNYIKKAREERDVAKVFENLDTLKELLRKQEGKKAKWTEYVSTHSPLAVADILTHNLYGFAQKYGYSKEDIIGPAVYLGLNSKAIIQMLSERNL